MSKETRNLRELLQASETVVMPGAFDALSAKIIEMLGFKAIFHTGYGTAASLLCQPDVGLVSFKEMRDRVESIARAVNIPVVGDADTGYGNAINVYRTVKEYIWAGAAGLYIEDQIWPKRCGHMFGKQIIEKEEMVGKVIAALDARDEEDPDFVIGARTDAIAVEGIDEAIERAEAYFEAGADFIFIDAYENLEQMEKAVKEVKAPLMLNLVEGGRTPIVSVQEAEKLGFKMVIFPVTALYSAAKAMYDNLLVLRESGSAEPYLEKIITFPEFARIVGVEKIRTMEQKYLPKKVLRRKYGDENV